MQSYDRNGLKGGPVVCLYYKNFTPKIVSKAADKYRYLAKYRSGNFVSPEFRYDLATREYCSNVSVFQK